jgi:hypothetical protein
VSAARGGGTTAMRKGAWNLRRQPRAFSFSCVSFTVLLSFFFCASSGSRASAICAAHARPNKAVATVHQCYKPCARLPVVAVLAEEPNGTPVKQKQCAGWRTRRRELHWLREQRRGT